MNYRFLPLVMLAAVAGAACDRVAPEATAAHDAAPHPPGYVVDSILPMDEHLRRFRAGADSVGELRGAAKSRDDLVARYMAALANRDTTTLVSLLVSHAEFAWLLFPSHPYYSPPYEMPPALLWFQIRQGSEKGLARALERLGGRALNYQALVCPDDGREIQGGNAMVNHCRVVVDRPGVGRDTIRLFGSILERGGRFKFVSYVNDL